MKALPGEKLLRHLPLEFDTVCAVLCHGFHPLKARRPRSTPYTSPVRVQGRTPIGGQFWTPIDNRVASASELFRRLGSQSERIESGCGGIIEITNAQRKSFETLHRLRNGFTHFSPRGWSIELRLIRDIVPDILDIIEQIANDWWPFRHMSEVERKLLRDRISELRCRFSDTSIGVSRM